MTYLSTHRDVRAVPLGREQVAEMLSRYPRVSDCESRHILTFLRKGRQLDLGLLIGDDRLRPNLAAFMADHEPHFRVKWREAAAMGGFILGPLAIFWLAVTVFA